MPSLGARPLGGIELPHLGWAQRTLIGPQVVDGAQEAGRQGEVIGARSHRERSERGRRSRGMLDVLRHAVDVDRGRVAVGVVGKRLQAEVTALCQVLKGLQKITAFSSSSP